MAKQKEEVVGAAFKKGQRVSVIDSDEVGTVHDINTNLTSLQTQYWVKFTAEEGGKPVYTCYAADELEAVEVAA